MPTRCFLVVPTGIDRRFLRRYVRDQPSPAVWTCPGGWHQAMTEIEWENTGHVDRPSGDLWPHDDPRWPRVCEHGCGYAFRDVDVWQLFRKEVHRPADGSRGSYTLWDRTPGMMWDAPWMGPRWRGADGHSYVVVTPDGHQWAIDGPASNCTTPDDADHRCWIRHGTAPALTVDKSAGGPDASAPRTCAAGAGSCVTPGWHGFLRGGVLEP